MSLDFNVDEIFEMAEQIERNGAGFYRKAAQGGGDTHACQLLLDLAAMEEEHERVFASMRKELSKQERESTVFDPYQEAVLYLRAMADGVVFDVKDDPSKRLTGKESMGDILRTAVGLEKDSIVFYLGMKDLIPERLGKGKVDDIVKEEMKHITLLSRQLRSLKQ
ncbi:MAG: ferritin family protein [bacterium]